MSEKFDPPLIPAIAELLVQRVVRTFRDPAQFKAGAILVVVQSVTGTHQWDRGMASGSAEVTLIPGDVVECLGRSDTSDLSVLPVADNIEVFIKRAVNAADQPYVERQRLVVDLKGRELGEFFSVRDT
jgi:hypothetical protein